MPYSIGEKGSYGCSGYPAIKDGTNEVMGCHTTRAAAAAQIYAINMSEGNIDKAMQTIKEGDFVMGMTSEGMVHGVVEHIMIEGGVYGVPGTEYAIQSMPPENPAMAVRIYKEEDGKWEPTAYSIGMMYKDAMVVDINNHSMEDDEEDDDDEMDSEVAMAMYDSSIGKREMANAPYEDYEGVENWDNVTKSCWVGYEQQGMKEKDGRMVPNCVPVGKTYSMDDEIEKAKSVSVGDHVTFAVPKPPDKTESAHGVVERVERSGTVKLPGTNESVEASSDNPVAVIRVYATNEGGTRTRTDRRVVKPFSSLRVSSEPIDNEKMYDRDEEMEKVSSARLQELADEYNKNKEGDKRITVGALRQVYNRGIGAYRTNPSSVRGSVSSAEQWAMGRVNAFMAGLRGRFPRKPFDLDLFPKGHPRSTKKSLFEDFAKDVGQPQRISILFEDREIGEKMEKRDYSMDARRTMAESGMAMPDGSFPIANGGDLQNAIQSVGRAANYAAAKEHIIRRARALGMMDMLPEDWRNNATKGMGQWSGSIFDLNPFVK